MDDDFIHEPSRTRLLAIARAAVERAARGGPGNPAVEATELTDVALLPAGGVFVTLWNREELRGCVGFPEANRPLDQAVAEAAFAAATHDPRFDPIQVDELADLCIDISLLSTTEAVEDIQTIELGRDGLLIRAGERSGLLLPEVPIRWGWNREQFLEQTARKAGLAPDGWKHARVLRFTTRVLTERDFPREGAHTR